MGHPVRVGLLGQLMFNFLRVESETALALVSFRTSMHLLYVITYREACVRVRE